MIFKIKQDFRTFKKDTVYDFSELSTFGYLTIVGANGCGKSTLFHCLRGLKNDAKTDSLYENDFRDLTKNVEITHNYDKIFYFDRIKDDGNNLNVGFDAVNFINSGGFYTANKSHGESSLIYLGMFLDKNKSKFTNKTLLVLDEFDTGFSLKTQAKSMSVIYKLLADCPGINIITITHNPFLIIDSFIVYNFETRTYETSNDYLKDTIGFKIEHI